jgi:hypothetical protein
VSVLRSRLSIARLQSTVEFVAKVAQAIETLTGTLFQRSSLALMLQVVNL